jgi:hypothetical protein
MTAGGRDFQRALGMFLAHDFAIIDGIVTVVFE